ncbi:MRG-domain-containing protein [Fimicolochytrium jonesii]|uniref:MRG-domain-containing protein n=1 Tax=Fimicolochytrium jonesii TaxID=1396493 RepID=UPI0022FE1BF4|nr:MRG-domain-containing protein [Fimicolochytrium jonesii]KAI8821401.1 MRG-domain-containing protein [Fimicolochytrium jonesii]
MSINFNDGEQILCFHGPMLYEAKVLKAEIWTGKADHEDGPYYYIHYKGWKQSWDEWVPEARILKYNAENLARQAELHQTLNTKKAKDAKKSQAKEESKDTKGRKRPREHDAEKEDDFLKRPEVKITIPDALKSQLVEDWENVTKNHRLVRLPRDVTVVDVLERYKASLQSSKGKRAAKESARFDDSLQEVLDGIRIYFDRSLGNLLLYRFERQQYVDLKKGHPDKPMSDLYGAEHLLRLFVQFPALIAHSNMETDAIAVLKDHLTHILEFLEAHQQELFLKEYDNASPAYLAQMKAGS